PPPGMFVVTRSAAGPVCLRLLNHTAVNQTCAPGAAPSNVTSITVLDVFPWNVQSVSSLGGVAPTKLYTCAPSTPSGLPRLGPDARCNRMRTLFPAEERMSISGASAGAATGVRLGRGNSPSEMSCASFTVGVAYTIFDSATALT